MYEFIKDLIGKEILVVYEDFGKDCRCFGKLISFDGTFVTIETSTNNLFLQVKNIQKIKERVLND